MIFILLGLVLAQNATQNVTTVTVTAPSASPSNCPSLFSCDVTPCLNFGICSNRQCVCPDGYGGPDCSSLTCNSSNLEPNQRVLRNGTCTCDEGFTGDNCNVCLYDKACKARSSSPIGGSYVCNKLNTVWQSSNMVCEVYDDLLSSVYPGNVSSTFNRNIRQGTVLAALHYKNQEQFVCKASSCSQSLVDGQYVFSCSSVSCQCIENAIFCGGPGSTINIKEVVNKIEGLVKFTFPSETANIGNLFCKFITNLVQNLASFFPTGLGLGPCTVGECVDQSFQISLSPIVTPPLTAGAIAVIAITSTLCFMAILFFIYARIVQLRLRKIPCPAPRTGASLEFKNVGYAVDNKNVLSGINGAANAGRVLAILGPSGIFR